MDEIENLGSACNKQSRRSLLSGNSYLCYLFVFERLMHRIRARELSISHIIIYNESH